MAHDHINIAVLDAKTPGVERVPARRLANGDWELLRCPLYALHVAAGDVIRILDVKTGLFEIVTRGANVVVQLYLGERDADDAQATAKAAADIEQVIASFGGRMDGQTAGLIVFCVPIKAGLAAIEEVFEDAIRRFDGAQWQYGNVYHRDDLPLAALKAI